MARRALWIGLVLACSWIGLSPRAEAQCGVVPGSGCPGGPVLLCTGPPSLGDPWSVCASLAPGQIGQVALLTGAPLLPVFPPMMCNLGCNLAGFPLFFWTGIGPAPVCLFGVIPPNPVLLGQTLVAQAAWVAPAGCWTLSNAITGTIVP